MARGREDAVEAAKHEARQSLEVKEEGVAHERYGGVVCRRGAGRGCRFVGRGGEGLSSCGSLASVVK